MILLAPGALRGPCNLDDGKPDVLREAKEFQRRREGFGHSNDAIEERDAGAPNAPLTANDKLTADTGVPPATKDATTGKVCKD